MQNHLTKFTNIYEGFYSMKTLKMEKTSKKERSFKNLISTKGLTKNAAIMMRSIQIHLTKFTKIYGGFYSIKAMKMERTNRFLKILYKALKL